MVNEETQLRFRWPLCQNTRGTWTCPPSSVAVKESYRCRKSKASHISAGLKLNPMFHLNWSRHLKKGREKYCQCNRGLSCIQRHISRHIWYAYFVFHIFAYLNWRVRPRYINASSRGVWMEPGYIGLSIEKMPEIHHMKASAFGMCVLRWLGCAVKRLYLILT